MVCTTLDIESPIQAVCGKAARTDLGGGREVTRVPTANEGDAAAQNARLWHISEVAAGDRSSRVQTQLISGTDPSQGGLT
jgi:hypothetical protein